MAISLKSHDFMEKFKSAVESGHVEHYRQTEAALKCNAVYVLEIRELVMDKILLGAGSGDPTVLIPLQGTAALRIAMRFCSDNEITYDVPCQNNTDEGWNSGIRYINVHFPGWDR